MLTLTGIIRPFVFIVMLLSAMSQLSSCADIQTDRTRLPYIDETVKGPPKSPARTGAAATGKVEEVPVGVRK